MRRQTGKRRIDSPRWRARAVRIGLVTSALTAIIVSGALVLDRENPARTFTSSSQDASDSPQEVAPEGVAATVTAAPTQSPSPVSTPTSTPGEESPDPTPTEGGPGTSDPPPLPDGFPDESTTGVPDGVELAESDSVTTTHDGQVIENLEITGMLDVEHANVTVRNVRIHATGPYAIRVPHHLEHNVTDLLIEDSELIGTGREQTTGLSPYGAWTARRLDISGFVDGVKVTKNQTLEDSWIHDLFTHGGSHNDGVQSQGGHDVVIRGNRIEGRLQAQTSAILISSNFAPIERFTIEGNLLVGGNYTLYLTDKGTGHGPPTDVSVQSNVWVSDSWQFGPLKTDRHPSWVWQNNQTDNGEPIE